MKNKDIKFFSIRLRPEEFAMLRELKEEYAVNISGAFKIFLKKHLDELRKTKT